MVRRLVLTIGRTTIIGRRLYILMLDVFAAFTLHRLILWPNMIVGLYIHTYDVHCAYMLLDKEVADKPWKAF